MRVPPNGEGRRLLIGLLLPHVLVVVPATIFVGITNGGLFVGSAILLFTVFSIQCIVPWHSVSVFYVNHGIRDKPKGEVEFILSAVWWFSWTALWHSCFLPENWFGCRSVCSIDTADSLHAISDEFLMLLPQIPGFPQKVYH